MALINGLPQFIDFQSVDVRGIKHNKYNNQFLTEGLNQTNTDSRAVYFISTIQSAAGITLKDADGNTIFTGVTDKQFYVPLRMDGGFSFTGTGTVHGFKAQQGREGVL